MMFYKEVRPGGPVKYTEHRTMSTRPPGLLRAAENPEVIMMICTAGHVDHGKTRLVKLFTGCATDRLKEEQERGLTIELGFAPCFWVMGCALASWMCPAMNASSRTW